MRKESCRDKHGRQPWSCDYFKRSLSVSMPREAQFCPCCICERELVTPTHLGKSTRLLDCKICGRDDLLGANGMSNPTKILQNCALRCHDLQVPIPNDLYQGG